MIAQVFPLTTSLQDVTALGTSRRFTMSGSPGTCVVFEYGSSLTPPSVGRVKDPRFPTIVAPTLPTHDLALVIGPLGYTEATPIFTEPSSFLRYTVLQGNVTECYVDAAGSGSGGHDDNDNTEM